MDQLIRATRKLSHTFHKILCVCLVDDNLQTVKTEKSLNISLEHKHTTGDKIKMKTKQETRKTRNKARLQDLARCNNAMTNAMTTASRKFKMIVHGTVK